MQQKLKFHSPIILNAEAFLDESFRISQHSDQKVYNPHKYDWQYHAET